jgi:hypothetical protein
MLRFLRRLRKDERGVSLTELALLTPPLLMLFVGVIEISFKLWSTQKAEKLSVTISDVVAQAQTVSMEGLGDIVDATDDIMDPFAFGDNGEVIISSIYRAQGTEDVKVNWQCIRNRPFGQPSRLGLPGDDATLPEDLWLDEKENVIVAEVFYTYQPILPGLLFDGDSVVYRRAFFKPRLGALTNPPEVGTCDL